MAESYNDEDLLDFIQTLDKSNVEVTEWEAEFIGSNMDAIAFTPKQRRSIQEMIDKYGTRIGWL